LLAHATAAQRKADKHTANVEAQGHRFDPWAAEAFGHIDPQMTRSIRTLSAELPPHVRKGFVSEMLATFAVHTQIGNSHVLRAHRLNADRARRAFT
jgi:hypothetical protein